MLRQRVQSAIVIVIAAIVPAVLGHPVLTVSLIILAALGIVEFARAVETPGVHISRWVTIAVASLLIAAAGMDFRAEVLLGIIVLGSTGLFLAAIIRGIINGATYAYAHSIAAVIYVALPLTHMLKIRSHGGENQTVSWFESINDYSLTPMPAEGLGWLVLIVAATWMTDSAAYLGGRAFGKNKLAPAISPAKTIEGALSGILIAAATGAGVVALLQLPVPVYAGAVLGLLISGLGQAGDLAESLIKRDLGIKDMGNLIPGHGGILDRIDALLFTLPAGFYLVLLATEVTWP
jgi:phosphatidate cytidylyltransferase